MPNTRLSEQNISQLTKKKYTRYWRNRWCENLTLFTIRYSEWATQCPDNKLLLLLIYCYQSSSSGCFYRHSPMKESIWLLAVIYCGLPFDLNKYASHLVLEKHVFGSYADEEKLTVRLEIRSQFKRIRMERMIYCKIDRNDIIAFNWWKCNLRLTKSPNINEIYKHKLNECTVDRGKNTW